MPLVRVRAHLSTPLALREPLHLDGLVVACSHGVSGLHLTRTCDESEIVRPRIPIMELRCRGQTTAICSAEILPPEAKRTSDHLTRRRDGEDLDYLTSPVETRSGPGRDVMLRFPTIETPHVEWIAFGRRKPILRLLRRRVQAVGMLRGHGYGMVREWEAESSDSRDLSETLVSGGVAIRNLPASWCEAPEVVERVPTRAPYWHPAMVGDGVRSGRRTGLHSEVLARLEQLLC